MNVVATGSSGKAERAVVCVLLEHDDEVLGIDAVPSAGSPAASLLADLTDFGQTLECLSGADAVVHLRFSNQVRRWNLWGYVDARDVAQSCRLALEADAGAGGALHRCRR